MARVLWIARNKEYELVEITKQGRAVLKDDKGWIQTVAPKTFESKYKIIDACSTP